MSRTASCRPQQCKIVHTDVKPENVLLRIPPIGDASVLEWWSRNREPPPATATAMGAGANAGQGAERLQKGWSLSWPGPESFRAKLVDLGNACPEARPFTDDIQTIEYRCPEVVVGAKFDSKVCPRSLHPSYPLVYPTPCTVHPTAEPYTPNSES
jgi:serine/threonine-protein kinase SRPK3